MGLKISYVPLLAIFVSFYIKAGTFGPPTTNGVNVQHHNLLTQDPPLDAKISKFYPLFHNNILGGEQDNAQMLNR